MVPPEVLSTVIAVVFRGCGLDPQKVLGSRKWRNIVCAGREHLRRFPEGTERGDAARLGPLYFGAALNGVKLRTNGNVWQIDPEVNAALRIAGEALIDSASACLPRTIPKPERGLYFSKKHRFPMTLADLRQRWLNGGDRAQTYTAEILANTLYGLPDTEITEEQDRADQPAERVLPFHYGPFVPGLPHRANCLGKALMVAGFGKLVGAPMLAAVPVITASIEHRIQCGKLADRLRRFIARSGIVLSKERAECLDAIVEFGKKRERYVDWLHMGIAMQLRSGRWLLVDPNQGITGRLPKSWRLSALHSTLRNHRFALPGLAVTKGGRLKHRNFEMASALCDINCAEVAPLEKIIRETNPGRDEILRLLRESDFMDSILEWNLFSKIDLPPDAPRTTKAICVLLEFLIEQERSMSKGANPWEFSGKKISWFIEVWCKSEEWLLSQLNDAEAREAFDRLVWKFISYGFEMFHKEREYASMGHDLIHPHCQFSLVEPGTALQVMSHVAADIGEDCSEETEALLSRHSFDQFRLLYSAAAPLRGVPRDPEVSKLSATILRALPRRLPNAGIVIAALDEEHAAPPPAAMKGAPEVTAEAVCP